jgi:hypothetical protein
MGDLDELRDIGQEALSPNGSKPKGWPKLPGHDAGPKEIRDYLTHAAQLPRNWQVEAAERHGVHPTDPLSITIRAPQTNVSVYFEAQRECSKAGALRGAFMEATRGASRMKYPKPAEASDFYAMVCALAHVGSTSTIADETMAWLEEYLDLAHLDERHSLKPPHRYDTLAWLRRRRLFDRHQANRYISGNLAPDEHWVALVDTETEELWIRAAELASYLRHVYGVGGIAMHTLDARIRELGGERLRVEENRHHGGGEHITIVMYRFPSVQAFPSVIRMHANPGHK